MSFASRAGFETLVTWMLAAPWIAIALWRSRQRRWWPLVAMLGIVAIDNFVLSLPRTGPFAGLAWSWQGKLLEIVLAIVSVAVTPGLTFDSIGVTAQLRPGWRAGLAAVVGVSLALPITFIIWLGARDTLTPEGWLFEATAPGIAEELIFRGVLLALADRAFGRPYRVAGAELGWGAIVTSVIFALVHVVNVERDGALHVELLLGIGPLIGGLIASWARARVGSLLPLMLAHNASNLVIPLVTYLL